MVLGTQLSIGMAHAQDPKFVYGTPAPDIEKAVWKASAQAGLILATGNANNLKYAEDHADIVRRFGRFPHRNPILGRATTEEDRRARA